MNSSSNLVTSDICEGCDQTIRRMLIINYSEFTEFYTDHLVILFGIFFPSCNVELTQNQILEFICYNWRIDLAEHLCEKTFSNLYTKV